MVNMARDFILSNLTTGAGEKAVEYLQGFIAGSDMTKVGVAGGLMGFFLLISLLRQIELLFNKIWSVEKDRNLLVRFMYFWTFLTLGLFLSSIVVSLLAQFRFGDISLNTEHLLGIKVFTQLVSWGAKILFCFLLYKIVPNCFISAREAFLGALVSGTLFHIAVYVYGFYASNSASYQTLYGAFAAVPIFLGWIYIVWIILILGAIIGRRDRLGIVSPEHAEARLFGQGAGAGMKMFRFRSLLPLLCLLHTYRFYHRGQGRGLSVGHLVGLFKIPEAWISDAFAVLTHQGYVIACDSGESANESLGAAFVPAKPAQQLALSTLQSTLAPPIEEWSATWTEGELGEIHDVLMKMLMGLRTTPEASLADVLA